ncbi:MAG: hypothetical protein ABIG34_03880 [Candidatus Peregrinibacteria bacterium]
MQKRQPWWHGMRCAYCPNTAENEDHIPPRSLYAKGTPDLVTVPSCEACRKKYSKDDELFKTLLVHDAGVGNPVSKTHFLGSVARAMKRFVGLGPKIAAQTVTFDVLTKSGLFTGEKVRAIEISDEDWRRVQVVLIRIARGLNYRFSEWKERYDDHWYNVVDFKSEDGQKILANADIMAFARSAKTIIMGDGRVCRAKVIPFETVKNGHLWLFEFYETRQIFVLATPKGRAKEAMERRRKQSVSPSGIILKTG